VAVALDAQSNAVISTSSGASLSGTPITVGGSATLLIAVLMISITNNVNAVPSMTWNGGAPTGLAASATSNGNNATTGHGIFIYYWVTPTSGAQTLAASWTGGNSEALMWAYSFTGTSAGALASIFPNTTLIEGTFTANPSATLTSATGHIGVGATTGYHHGSNITLTQTAGFTSALSTDNYASTYASGAASLTWTATSTGALGTDPVYWVLLDIAPPAAAAAFTNDLWFDAVPKQKLPLEFMQGPFAGVSPALSSPWVQAPLFEPTRLKPTTLFEWNAPGTSPQLSSPYVQAPFFDPTKLKPKLAEGTPYGPGTSPALVSPYVQAPFFDPTKLKQPIIQVPDIVPPLSVAAVNVVQQAFFDALRLMRPVVEAPPIIPGTNPAIAGNYFTSPFFDAVRLKPPIVQNPDIVPPMAVVVVY
jgi:hypothetical protein